MHFEWHEPKNRANFKNHGVWFEEAQTVWADRNAVEFFDPDHSFTEERFIRLGLSTNFKLLLVVFCEKSKGRTMRIISARKATVKERKQYEEGI